MSRSMVLALGASAAFWAMPATAAEFVRYSFTGIGAQSTTVYDLNSGVTFIQSKGATNIAYLVPIEYADQPSYRLFTASGALGNDISSNVSLTAGTFKLEETGYASGALGPNFLNISGYSTVLGSALPNAGSYQITATFSYKNNQPRSGYDTSAEGNITRIDVDRVSGNLVAGLQEVSVVPEPATWALMLAGFGMMAYALRWRPRLSYAL